MQPSPSKIWSRDFTLLFLSSLLAWGSFYTLVPTLPLYASERLGASPTQVGTILNILTVSAILARLLTGYALDRWGRRLVYLLSLAAFAVVASSYLRAASLLLLAVMRLLHGVPFGSATTASNTIAADLVPPERRGEGMGAFALGSTLAMAFGPALALAVLDEGQFARLFALGGGLAMVALGLALAVRYPKLRNSQATFSLGSLFERRVGWLALFAALITTGYGAIVTFITIYAMEYGIPRAGMFFTVFALGLVVSRVVGGRIFDRLGPRLPVLGGTAVMAAALLLLGLWPGAATFLAAALVFGLGYGALNSSLLAMSVNSVPAERRGAANAAVLSAMDLGIGVGGGLLGLVAEAARSYGVMFVVAAAALVVPAVLFVVAVLPAYQKAET